MRWVKHPHTGSRALGFALTSSLAVCTGLPWAFPFPLLRPLLGAQRPRSGSALLRHKEHHPWARLRAPPAQGASPQQLPGHVLDRSVQRQGVNLAKREVSANQWHAAIEGIFREPELSCSDTWPAQGRVWLTHGRPVSSQCVSLGLCSDFPEVSAFAALRLE